MPSLFSLALAAMLASSLVAAAPSESVRKTQSVGRTSSLKTVRKANAASDIPSGLVNYAREFVRRGIPVPEGLARGLLRRTTTGSLSPVSDFDSGQWISEAEFGTPPQTLPIILDTGSWDCIVFSSQTPASIISELPEGTPVYEPEKSKTAELLDGYTFKILYGTGNDEANGDVFRDVLTIGGVTAPSQAVESVLNCTPIFTELGGTGVVGMALSKNNTVRPVKQDTFFQNIMDELALPVFTADLYLEAESFFDLGFINESLIDGSITWTDVDTSDSQQGWWAIPVDGYQVGSGPSIASPFTTIVDTGTQIILLPGDVVSAYYDRVPTAYNSTEFGGYVFDCNEKLPDIDIVISGRSFTVSADLLNLGQVEGNTCIGNIQFVPPSQVPDLPEPEAVLGATFMLEHLVSFDLGNLQIGMAQKRYIENATFLSYYS